MRFIRRVNVRTTSVALTIILVAGVGLFPCTLPGSANDSEYSPRVLSVAPAKIQAQTVTPQAITVSPTLDTDHAITQTLTPAGGTLVATGADGTRFTLYLPIGALLSDAAITMTPVSSLGGDPFSGGLAGAVQLAPEGLLLSKFGTLVIEPPSPVSPGEESPYNWASTGVDFHLFPLYLPDLIDRDNAAGGQPVLDRTGLVFKVQHLSGYGVSHGTDQERATVAQNLPAAADAQFEVKLDSVIAPIRLQELTGASAAESAGPVAEAAGPPAALVSLFSDEYTNDVKPSLDNAIASGDLIQLICAIQKALAWEQDVNLYGLNTTKFFVKAVKKLNKSLTKALQLAIKKALGGCGSQPDAYFTILTIIQEMDELGIDHSSFDTQIGQCSALELDFQSHIHVTGSTGEADSVVSAKVPLTNLMPKPPANVGTAPLNYVSFSFVPISPCTASVTDQGDQTVVVSIDFDMNPRRIDCPNPQPGSSSRVVSVLIAPGRPTETVTVYCGSGAATVPGIFWFAAFAILHQPEVVPDLAGPVYTISNWAPGIAGTSLLGQKTYNKQAVNADVILTEETTLQVVVPSK